MPAISCASCKTGRLLSMINLQGLQVGSAYHKHSGCVFQNYRGSDCHGTVSFWDSDYVPWQHMLPAGSENTITAASGCWQMNFIAAALLSAERTLLLLNF